MEDDKNAAPPVRPVDPIFMTNRQSGRTTAQMRNAPKGATFVWPVPASRSYAQELAQKLGRADLRIVALGDDLGQILGGQTRDSIVVDHSCGWFDHGPTRQAYNALMDALAHAKPAS